ncbi:MAG TPA: hypothetical protein VL481_01425 [Verrucomicrobiae bacterium]|nr:hypothetical protein [Verrucomicrobiae bacterium]
MEMDSRLNEIDWSYRESVARRERERAERDRRAAAAQLFLMRFVALTQLVFSILFLIGYSAVYFVENVGTITSLTDRIVFTIGFVIAEGCGWTYTLLFPRYFSNLE